MRRMVRRSEPQPHGQRPTRRGAQRHQQIHIAGARQQRVPTGLVETRSQNELHRRGQQKLPQRGQHPIFAKQVAHHGQHQRRAQRQANGHRPKARPWRDVHCVNGRTGRQRLVARIAHRAAQAGFHASVMHFNACGFGGQVHRGAVHAGHFLQGFFHAHHTRCAGHAANADIDGRGGCSFSSHGRSLGLAMGGRSSAWPTLDDN